MAIYPASRFLDEDPNAPRFAQPPAQAQVIRPMQPPPIPVPAQRPGNPFLDAGMDIGKQVGSDYLEKQLSGFLSPKAAPWVDPGALGAGESIFGTGTGLADIGVTGAGGLGYGAGTLGSAFGASMGPSAGGAAASGFLGAGAGASASGLGAGLGAGAAGAGAGGMAAAAPFAAAAPWAIPAIAGAVYLAGK